MKTVPPRLGSSFRVALGALLAGLSCSHGGAGAGRGLGAAADAAAASAPNPERGPVGAESAAAPRARADVGRLEATGAAGPETGAGSAACPHLLCEDFEGAPADGPADPAVWKPAVWGEGAKVRVDALKARGKRALHATGGLLPNDTQIRTSKGFPTPGNAHFGRVWFYVDKFHVPAGSGLVNGVIHFNVVEAWSPDRKAGVRFGGIFNPFTKKTVLHWDTETPDNQNEAGASDDGAASALLKEKTWTCLEWQLDGGTHELRVWLDGAERPKLTQSAATNPAKPFVLPEIAHLEVGWAQYQEAAAPYDVWVDDLAVGTARVGCGR